MMGDIMKIIRVIHGETENELASEKDEFLFPNLYQTLPCPFI